MFKILSFLFLGFVFAFGVENVVVDINLTLQKQKELNEQKKGVYLEELKKLEDEISKSSVWTKSYESYLTSLNVRNNLKDIKKRIKYLKKRAKTITQKDELSSLISKENILTAQMEELKGKGEAPFSELLTPPEVGDVPTIKNPFDIFTGLSLIKKLDKDLQEYLYKKKKLKELVVLLRQEIIIYKSLVSIDKTYQKEYLKKNKQLEMFETAYETMDIASGVYQKRVEVVESAINRDIKEQTYGAIKISIVIIVIFIFFFLMKLVVKRYITDNERFYMANKIITFTNFTFIILILFFNYIENVSYIITILGFASAGIAIAMKDWFMSILGWLVIVFGGSIHVGDRIRVDMDGMKYVGDVLDISLLRITILEDITLTSIMQNRRAGRIIFVPNNYIFTRMIANYTHSSLKTVWDGINISITFESNHKKALHIVKEITKKYSKGYTDITRKQLNKLRHQYSLKNTNVEPRIYSFIAPHGINIEAWYLTNAYGTLTLRSSISAEIIDAFKEADDIVIAYPTQNINLQTKKLDMLEHNGEVV